MGAGSVNTNWGPGLVNTNWGVGLVNINWRPGQVNTNWRARVVNTNWGPVQWVGGVNQGQTQVPSKSWGLGNTNTCFINVLVNKVIILIVPAFFNHSRLSLW